MFPGAFMHMSTHREEKRRDYRMDQKSSDKCDACHIEDVEPFCCSRWFREMSLSLAFNYFDGLPLRSCGGERMIFR